MYQKRKIHSNSKEINSVNEYKNPLPLEGLVRI